MANLQSFPTELLLQITGYLPPSAQVSLKLVNKNFFYRTPQIPQSSFKDCSPCERNAYRRSFYEGELLSKKQRRCVLCDGVQPADFFTGAVPICKWHDGRFFHLSISPNLETTVKYRLTMIAQSTTKVLWAALKRMYCAHEREIIGWDIPQCSCDCQTCGRFEVVCYVRLSPYFTTPLGCQLDREHAGNLWVREAHFGGG